MTKPTANYVVKVACDNCGHRGSVTILKGLRVETHSCPNCGCGSLKRVNWL